MSQKLGELLIEQGRLTEAQLKTALRTQEFFGGHLGSILIDLDFLEERALGETLARATGVRYAPQELLEEIPEEVLKAVPAKVAERYKVLPIRIQEKRLHLVMLNPRDLVCLDEISYITGMVLVPYIAPEFRIYQALERHYQVAPARPQRITLAGKVDPNALVNEPPPPPAPEEAPPPVTPPGIGLDGLPLDAEVTPGEHPYSEAAVARMGSTGEFLEQLPRSLSEWRDSPAAAAPVAESRSRRVELTPVVPRAPEPQPPPPRPKTPPPPREDDPLRETAERLLRVESRDDIAEVLLHFTGRFFRRRLLFSFQRDRIVGWDGWGDGVSRDRVRNVLMPLESLSLFSPLRSSVRPYRGPVADLPSNRRMFEDLALAVPPEVVLLPVVLKERVVAAIYGDNAPGNTAAADLDVLARLALQGAIALEILILRNKMLSA